MHVSRIQQADQRLATAFLRRDPVAGGLIHSLVLRHGWHGQTAYWGLWNPAGCRPRLEGIVSLDARGRGTVCGGGLAWVDQASHLLRSWLDGTAARLSYFDAPAAMAGGLAEAVRPTSSTALAILTCERAAEPEPSPAQPLRPAELTIRRVNEGDIAALAGLYRDEASLAWVDVPGTLAMCRDGHRLCLVGVKGEEIVTAGWGNTLEPGAARLSGIITRPDQRGRGYATALTAELTDRLTRQGRIPFLYVATADAAAFALYHRLGYRLHSERVGLTYGGSGR